MSAWFVVLRALLAVVGLGGIVWSKRVLACRPILDVFEPKGASS
jgi:hypothetical protein